MGCQRGPTKARWWHLGVPLTVGLAAILVGLMRARRPVSRAHAAESGQASQGLDSVVVGQSSQVNLMRRSSGLPRLALWAGARASWIIVVAGLGVWSLAVAIGQSHETNPPLASASATVISSRNNGDPQDLQIWVDVWFRTKSDRIVRATIQPYPYGLGKISRGEKLPIRYNTTAPSQAAYNGPGGDDGGYFDAGALEGPAYFGAAAWLSLAVALLLTGLSRFIGITRAALTSVATPVRLRTSGELVYADQLTDCCSLEWRVLPGQPDISGDVRILGEPAPGRWLIVRLDDGRLVWPGSSAYPMLASAAWRLPVVQSGCVGSVHLLLAGYAQIVDLMGTLPVVIRRRPESKADWWSLGALRPVTRALVTIHARRRLAALSGGLLRAALLCDESNSQARRILAETSEECRTFARALPRRSIVAALAAIAATSLSILSPFLLMPHIELRGRVISKDVPLLLVGVLIFGVAPLLIFFRSVRWKRALFNPPSASTGPAIIGDAANGNPNWDVYELERAAFTAVAVPVPSEWESWKLIRWLVVAIYVAAIVIPFAFGAYVIFPFGRLDGTFVFPCLGAWVALFSLVKTYKWQRRMRTLQATLDPLKLAEETVGDGGKHPVPLPEYRHPDVSESV